MTDNAWPRCLCQHLSAVSTTLYYDGIQKKKYFTTKYTALVDFMCALSVVARLGGRKLFTEAFSGGPCSVHGIAQNDKLTHEKR